MTQTVEFTEAQQAVLDKVTEALVFTDFEHVFDEVRPSDAFDDHIRLYCAENLVTGIVMEKLQQATGHCCAVTTDHDGRMYVLAN